MQADCTRVEGRPPHFLRLDESFFRETDDTEGRLTTGRLRASSSSSFSKKDDFPERGDGKFRDAGSSLHSCRARAAKGSGEPEVFEVASVASRRS